jgi:hypothetical protein
MAAFPALTFGDFADTENSGICKAAKFEVD